LCAGQLPLFERNFSPIVNLLLEKERQYTTRACAQKLLRVHLSKSRVPGCQTLCVITRAPPELMFCVKVLSVTASCPTSDNWTGSFAGMRGSVRGSLVAISFTRALWATSLLSLRLFCVQRQSLTIG
jgi:hypothetical protein